MSWREILFNNNELSIMWYSPSSHRSRGGLQNAEWLGLLVCPTTIGYESVPIACPGDGKAHTTPRLLASCSKPCPKHLNTEIDSCPFIAVLNQKCCAKGDVPSNKLVDSSVFHTGHCKSLPPGRPRGHGHQPRSSHGVLPGMDVVLLARSHSHR